MKEKTCNIAINGTEELKDTELEHIRLAIITDLPEFEGVYHIERIAANLSPSARVYKLMADNETFVLRILDREQYLDDSTNEIKLMLALSEEGVAPPVYHANVDTGLIIMKFINNTSVFHAKSAIVEEALIDLANKIKRLHTVPLRAKPTSLLPSNLQKERLNEVYQRATVHEALQIYLQGVEYLTQLSVFIQPNSFCHNNLHKYNVLHSGEGGYIIDWETAGAGDPFLDLANFIALARLTTQQETVFLTSYLGHDPSEIEFAKFQIMKQISFLRYSLGNFATIKLEQVNLDSLDFDKIPVFSDLTFVHSLSTPQDQFIYSFSILKQALITIPSAVFIEAVRLLTIQQDLSESILNHRLFTFSNPKAIQRALLTVRPHLIEEATQPTIESLSGGSKQATNYKVEVNDHFVALRVYDEEMTTQQFKHELSLYQHAEALGLGPELQFFNDKLLCLATSFVRAPSGWQTKLNHSQLIQLAEQIKQLHEKPFFIETPQQTLTGLPLTSLKRAKTLASDLNLSALQDILSLYNRLLPILKPEVLSHNSLSRDNILFDGNDFHFIDWENATFNDRLYDPAFLSCYFFLKPEQEKILLTTYLGHEITQAEEKKFYLMKLLVLCHLSIVTITKCQDFEFIKTLPQLDSGLRYFNYQGKARHLLNLQTDFSKYLIYQLLVNEVQFIIKTGKFLICEKSFLKALREQQTVTFGDLPLIAHRTIFSHLSQKALAIVAPVSKDWARTYYSLANDNFSELTGIEAVHPDNRTRVLTALNAIFMPYKPQNSEVDDILSPAVACSITPFTAGMSPWANTSKLVINDKPYVIRLLSLEPDPSCARLEMLIMQLFSAIGASPKVHYACDTLGVIIMDFVDATPAWYRQVTAETLTQLGLIFNLMNEVKLSSTKPFCTNKRLKQIYDQVYQICREDYASDPRFTLFREMLDELDALKPLCEELTEYTICHHDCNVWNLLEQQSDHSFKVIDLEFSDFGDRLFDLASLVVFMRLQKAAELELLTSFFGRTPSEAEQSKYYLFKQYAWLHYIVMGLGICKALDFDVTAEEIEELPPFNKFTHATTLSTPLDPHSDVGHYKLAIMFIKQAKIDSQKEEYLASLDCLLPKTEDLSDARIGQTALSF